MGPMEYCRHGMEPTACWRRKTESVVRAECVRQIFGALEAGDEVDDTREAVDGDSGALEAGDEVRGALEAGMESTARWK